jgi:hypothetical protein
VAFRDNVLILLRQSSPVLYKLNGMPVLTHAFAQGYPANSFVATSPAEIVSEPALLIEKLYASADTNDRKAFASILIDVLHFSNARVVARTLLATGHLDVLEFVDVTHGACEELWNGLTQSLRLESHLAGPDDLTRIEEMSKKVRERALVEGSKEVKKALVDPRLPGSLPVTHVIGHLPPLPVLDTLDELDAVIDRIRYLRLAHEIRTGQNPIIDSDRQVLLSRLQKMGVSTSLTAASNEIERRAAAATTAMDVKSVMDLARTFFEEFTEEACRKIEKKLGKTVPPGGTHFGSYKDYLSNAAIIDSDETKLLQSLYNFLSNQGAHKLGSAPEQLRVAHATVIEWCMLIAGRILEYLK